MHRILRVAAVFALLVAVTSCKKDLGPTDIDVAITASVAHLDHIKLAVRDQNVDKTVGYAYAYKDIPDGSSKTNPLDRDLTQKPVVVRLSETPVLKGKPFLLYVEGYVTAAGVSSENLVVAGAITLEYQEHKTQQKKVVLNGDFVANDKDHDGFRACGTYTPSDDPEEQGFFNDAQYCDCNDNNALINPFNNEVCGDGIDNNCTGWPYDENCTDCLQDLPCSSLDPSRWSSVGVGICVAGHRACLPVNNADGSVGHQLSPDCVGEVPPAPSEIPNNGLDDDCDGAVDEGTACDDGTPPRDCFLGQIGAKADQLAKGLCKVGTQACVGGTWDIQCKGETDPQRPPRDTDEQNNIPANHWSGLGFYELEIPNTDPTKNLAQCNGLDDDCDGFVDEEPSFDIDGDSYTICGTKDVPPASGIPRQHVNPDPADDPIFLQTPDLIDCDDSNPNVNPGAHEICNNGLDDDCRCDRGDFLGQFSTADGGCGDQPYDSAQLICDQDQTHPYNQNNGTIPQGKCDDMGAPFYLTVQKTDVGGTQTQTCFPCRGVFGYTCDTGGTNVCSSKEKDCASCSNPTPTFNGGAGSASAVPRPKCAQPAPGSCQGANGPSWIPVTRGDDGGPGSDIDDRDDCGAVSCAGWFAGFTDSANLATLCYQQSDASADAVKCAGNTLTPQGTPGCQPDGTGCCEVAADVCGLPHGDTATLATQRPPACNRWNVTAGGCSGTTAPTPVAQDPGSDLFNDCVAGGSCVTSYDSLQSVNVGGTNFTLCFPKADVTDATATCNGTGGCRDLATNCAANGRSTTPDPARPKCQFPTSGCTPGVSPGGYQKVAAGTDPFDDCAGAQVCDANAQCKGANGDACSGNGDCQSGFCTDGLCCESACGGSCQVCGAGGHCQTRSAGDNSECAVCSGCSGGTSCTTQADGPQTGCSSSSSFCCAGSCNTSAGTFNAACGTADCSSGHWACNGATAHCTTEGNTCGICMGDTAVNGTCSRNGSTCSGGGTDCSVCDRCTDAGTSANCSTPYSSGSQDNTAPNLCQGTDSCDGSGHCSHPLGAVCSDDTQCVNGHCVDNHCCGSAACLPCQTCGVSSDGSCSPVTSANDSDSCAGFCCQGACVEIGVGTFGSTCGNGDCSSGHWRCSGASAACDSQGSPCDGFCSGDMVTSGATCGSDGNCNGASSSNNCAVCSSCVDSGGSASCQIVGANNTDSTSPGLGDGSNRPAGGGCASAPCACDGGGSGASHCQDFP